MANRRPYEEYLGDGLYADYDGFQIILSANDRVGGENSTDKVALEPRVVSNFESYIKKLREKRIPI